MIVPIDIIQAYRQQKFLTVPGKQLKNIHDAIKFVNERGYIFFWPISGILLPSLWVAVAGDRPVADAHDDPGHKTWGWKDDLLGKKTWYYAKVLRKRATIISLDIVPYFYALSENYGAPDEDYLTLYEQGRLTQEAKLVYEALLFEGPLDTINLRRAVHMTSSESDARFERALADLQANFQILPIGVADVGAWHYAFIYEIVTRHFPNLPEQAQFIRESEARKKILSLYFLSVGAAQMRDLLRLFNWSEHDTIHTVDLLAKDGFLVRGLGEAEKNKEWIYLSALINSR